MDDLDGTERLVQWVPDAIDGEQAKIEIPTAFQHDLPVFCEITLSQTRDWINTVSIVGSHD